MNVIDEESWIVPSTNFKLVIRIQGNSVSNCDFFLKFLIFVRDGLYDYSPRAPKTYLCHCICLWPSGQHPSLVLTSSRCSVSCFHYHIIKYSNTCWEPARLHDQVASEGFSPTRQLTKKEKKKRISLFIPEAKITRITVYAYKWSYLSPSVRLFL